MLRFTGRGKNQQEVESITNDIFHWGGGQLKIFFSIYHRKWEVPPPFPCSIYHRGLGVGISGIRVF